jgi:hypothetical protein
VNLQGLDQWQQWALGIGCSLAAAFLIWLFKRSKSTSKGQTAQQNASPTMTQNFQPIINIHPLPTGATELGSGLHISSDWEVRYPGGVADVSMLSGLDRRLQRFAIGQDFTFINNSAHQVSLGVTFLIGYGSTQLATDPYSLPLAEWGQLLTAFGIANKPQLQFPLNLPPRSALEGHIVFSTRPDGAGKGIGGDVPDRRRYLFEFEELLSKQKVTRVASAVHAPDKNNHQRCYQTDLARPGPNAEPFIINTDHPISMQNSVPELVKEDGMLWRMTDNKRTGPYCPTCFEQGKMISLIEGATRGVYVCPIHHSQFWSKDFRDRAARNFRP